MRSTSSPRAVSIRTGVSEPDSRSWRSTSNPDRPGSMTSSTSRSYSPVCAPRRPGEPFETAVTDRPSGARYSASISVRRVSSSMISTRLAPIRKSPQPWEIAIMARQREASARSAGAGFTKICRTAAWAHSHPRRLIALRRLEPRRLDNDEVARQPIQRALRGAADEDPLQAAARDGAHHDEIRVTRGRLLDQHVVRHALLEMHVLRRHAEVRDQLGQRLAVLLAGLGRDLLDRHRRGRDRRARYDRERRADVERVYDVEHAAEHLRHFLRERQDRAIELCRLVVLVQRIYRGEHYRRLGDLPRLHEQQRRGAGPNEV